MPRILKVNEPLHKYKVLSHQDVFDEEHYKCPFFKWKVEDKRTKTEWCGMLNKSCRFNRCPRVK